MRKPDFFIVGAPKCGTTALYNYLKMHPDIFLPELKEPTYFGSDLPPIKDWYESKKEYLSWFSEAKNEKRVGEASTHYLYSRNAAKEIKKFSPQADIIIMLRNPVDMMYSLHGQVVFDGNQNILNFENALEAEKNLRKGGGAWKDARRKMLLYRDVASFSKQVKRYLDIFGSKKVHIIIFEEFVKDAPRAYAEVLNFLRVNDAFRINFKKINSDAVKNSSQVPRIKIFQKILNHSPLIIYKTIRVLIPRALRYNLYDSLKKINIKYETRPKLQLELRAKLQKEFKNEIKKLEKLINKDLSCWH